MGEVEGGGGVGEMEGGGGVSGSSSTHTMPGGVQSLSAKRFASLAGREQNRGTPRARSTVHARPTVGGYIRAAPIQSSRFSRNLNAVRFPLRCPPTATPRLWPTFFALFRPCPLFILHRHPRRACGGDNQTNQGTTPRLPNKLHFKGTPTPDAMPHNTHRASYRVSFRLAVTSHRGIVSIRMTAQPCTVMGICMLHKVV